MYIFSHLQLLRKDTVKISIWFSKKIQHTITFTDGDRKIALEFRERRTFTAQKISCGFGHVY